VCCANMDERMVFLYVSVKYSHGARFQELTLTQPKCNFFPWEVLSPVFWTI
jgi:hypothetical protein